MTIKKTFKIGWSKWQDPYDYNNDDDNVISNLDYNDDYHDNVSEFHTEKEEDTDKTNSHKWVMTSFGPIPIAPHSRPAKLFNFFIGHTNFPISRKIFKMIEDSDGVELLDVFTPYRMRVAVGQMFNAHDVLNNINKSVLKHVNQEPSSKKD